MLKEDVPDALYYFGGLFEHTMHYSLKNYWWGDGVLIMWFEDDDDDDKPWVYG